MNAARTIYNSSGKCLLENWVEEVRINGPSLSLIEIIFKSSFDFIMIIHGRDHIRKCQIHLIGTNYKSIIVPLDSLW